MRPTPIQRTVELYEGEKAFAAGVGEIVFGGEEAFHRVEDFEVGGEAALGPTGLFE